MTESTVRPWVNKYKEEIKKKSAECVIISQTRGRPLLLPAELDEKLRLFRTNMRTQGGTINKNAIYGILMSLIKEDMTRYDYLNFTGTKGWLQSLYSRMNMFRRLVTISRPKVTPSSWEEVRTQLHNDITSVLLKYNMPDELILNIDQTPLKFVPTEGLQNDQKTLILWDAFKAQSTDKVTKELERLNIVQVMVLKNMTHPLQLLDLTTNASVKKMEEKCFSEYFTNAITKEMLRDPKRDAITIEVDIRLSTLKPEHAKVIKRCTSFCSQKRVLM